MPNRCTVSRRITRRARRRGAGAERPWTRPSGGTIGTGGNLVVARYRPSADVAARLSSGAGDGIRTRDIQLGRPQSLPGTPGPALGQGPARAISSVGKAHKHVGRDHDNPWSVVPRKVRAVLTHLTGHLRDIARGHPATKKCRMVGCQEIAGQRDRLFDEVAQSQCLSTWMPAVVAHCTVLDSDNPAQGVVLKVPCALEVAHRVLHTSLPIRPRSASRASFRSLSRIRHQVLEVLGGSDYAALDPQSLDRLIARMSCPRLRSLRMALACLGPTGRGQRCADSPTELASRGAVTQPPGRGSSTTASFVSDGPATSR